MEELDYHFDLARTTPSDIYLHVDVLRLLSTSCRSVLELGTRSCVSSWGFLKGLASSSAAIGTKTLVSNDLDYHPNVDIVRSVANKIGIKYKFIQKNDLKLDAADFGGILKEFDIVFIDTWHIYGQLKRELEKFQAYAAKYIVLHDTDIDAEHGESVRMGHDVIEMANISGFPAEEITQGLQRAIHEFLEKHPDWFMLRAIHDGIGLTILARRKDTLNSVLRTVVCQKEDLLLV